MIPEDEWFTPLKVPITVGPDRKRAFYFRMFIDSDPGTEQSMCLYDQEHAPLKNFDFPRQTLLVIQETQLL